MNCVNNVSIAKNARTILNRTQEVWSCSAMPILTKDTEALEPASTTEPEGHAKKRVVSLKPSDPYPTWPFTQVEPKSLARGCKKNLNAVHQIEEAPF